MSRPVETSRRQEISIKLQKKMAFCVELNTLKLGPQTPRCMMFTKQVQEKQGHMSKLNG